MERKGEERERKEKKKGKEEKKGRRKKRKGKKEKRREEEKKERERRKKKGRRKKRKGKKRKKKEREKEEGKKRPQQGGVGGRSPPTSIWGGRFFFFCSLTICVLCQQNRPSNPPHQSKEHRHLLAVTSMGGVAGRFCGIFLTPFLENFGKFLIFFFTF